MNNLKLNIPALDLAASNEGRFFPWKFGISFKIARHGNPAYAEALVAILKTYEWQSDNTDVAEEICAMMADTILLDWKGLTDGDKENPKEVPYSREVAVELLTDEKYIELQAWVELTSKKMANYYLEETDSTVKS